MFRNKILPVLGAAVALVLVLGFLSKKLASHSWPV